MATRKRFFWKQSRFDSPFAMSSTAPVPDCILIAGYYGFGNTGDEPFYPPSFWSCVP